MDLHGELALDAINSTKMRGWSDGVLSCVWSVFSFVNRATTDLKQARDNWECSYEGISDLKWLGSGAQGNVFSGKLNGKVVAVKKVKDECETDIRHLRKLDHQNIVKFKGVCTQSPHYCVIMEYCPYGSLYNLLHEDRPITQYQLIAWAKDIAKGMGYLHSHKIIHRDLKSPNVLIGENDVVKVSDFGTSREWNEISTIMSFAGTVAWMAPEVIRNEPCSEKVDVWSYGVVLWELLTREIPYKNVDSSAIIWGVGNGSMSLPIPTTCPIEIQQLIKQCWDPTPKNRPSFKIMLAQLDIGSENIISQPVSKFNETQQLWKNEIQQHLERMPTWSVPTKDENDLIQKRKFQLKEAQMIKHVYKQKLSKINDLYMELSAVLLQLEQREKEIVERETAMEMKRCKCNKKLKFNYHRQTSTSPDVQDSINNLFENAMCAPRRKTEQSFSKRRCSKRLSNKLSELGKEVCNDNERENIDTIEDKDELDRLSNDIKDLLLEKNGNLKSDDTEYNGHNNNNNDSSHHLDPKENVVRAINLKSSPEEQCNLANEESSDFNSNNEIVIDNGNVMGESAA
ncbi:mitogen-activated protein kinase kinase kinase 13-like [Arctopsyche grandis]|uniref:mitogen-activated protein kinase kinase kinase 13-like n=1 Tax=Arctopsyche grandis TaxID=121162 RepID=UPI00406D66B5